MLYKSIQNRPPVRDDFDLTEVPAILNCNCRTELAVGRREIDGYAAHILDKGSAPLPVRAAASATA